MDKDFFGLSLKKWRSTRYLSRNLLIVGFLVLMTLMMPRSFRLNYQYDIGKAWTGEDLKAPFSFSIYKSAESYARERENAASLVLPIYVVDSSQMKLSQRRVITQLDTFYQRWSTLKNAQANKDTTVVKQLTQQFFQPEYKEIALDKLPAISLKDWNEKVMGMSIGLISEIYHKGYIRTAEPDTLGEFIALRVAKAQERNIPVSTMIVSEPQLFQFVDQQNLPLAPELIRVIRQVMGFHLTPNWIPDPRLTQEEKNLRRNLVSPVFGKVEAGEILISRDQIVDPPTDEKLASLLREQERRFGNESKFLMYLSQFFVVLLITMILLVYLSYNKPRIFFNNKKLTLIFTILLLNIGAMVLVNKLALRLGGVFGPSFNLSYIYLAPACIVPIFVSNFFDFRTGFLCNLLLALFGAVLVQQGLEYMYVQTLAGTVAVYSLRRIRERAKFFYTLGYIFLAYTLAYITFNLLGKGSFLAIDYKTILIFGINVAITVVAYNLIFLFERIFGLTSDLTYLELLDNNHPLLKELSRKASGTFQHSLQVANIAEATIKELGGDTLLIHVGALYHDIGKLAEHKYFIENMSEEEKQQNPHGQISCEKSAEIIIGHVTHGVELAQKYHLPQEIIQFIETHHGTTRVEFFYRQYLKENDCHEPKDEHKFRYPGPLPFSKETAVLMIADSIEAASRSLKNPTSEKLDTLVNAIIDHKIQDNQLENSNLTFKDISTIRKVISKQLQSIYHARIEYPKEAV